MPRSSDFAILFDASYCIGCRACQVGCKQWNDLPATETQNTGSYDPLVLSAQTWLKMSYHEGLDKQGEVYWDFTRTSCMHCSEAACVEACPTGAMNYRPGGVVTVDQDWCIGCRNCVQACPYDAVHYDEEKGVVQKCTLCHDRIANGLEPACVKACPTGALRFGTYGAMRRAARERVEALKAEGYDEANVYGLKEMGGTHVIYVLLRHPSTYGLPIEPMTQRHKVAVDWLSAGIAAATLGTLGWVIARREEVSGGES